MTSDVGVLVGPAVEELFGHGLTGGLELVDVEVLDQLPDLLGELDQKVDETPLQDVVDDLANGFGVVHDVAQSVHESIEQATGEAALVATRGQNRRGRDRARLQQRPDLGDAR